MATSGVSELSLEDLLTCTICLETFKVPKYLPCLHTFCESCIHTYIMSSVKEENAHEFKCPVCRRCVAITTNEGKPELWAEQLPGNHFVISLIDRSLMKKEERLCMACEIHNEQQPAVCWCTMCEEAYCEKCKKSHLSFKATAKHEIVSVRDIKEGKTSLIITGQVSCVEHPDKAIEIFCEDHANPCCTVCATIHHRKCEHVISIKKAASGIKESDKVSELMKKLAGLGEKINKVIENRKSAISHFETNTESVLAEIGQIRERWNKHLDNIEQRLRDEIYTTKKRVLLKLNDESAELSSMKSRVETWKQIFDACLHQGSELQCLIKFYEIQDKMPKFDSEISSLASGIQDTSIALETNDAIDNVNSIGHINVSESVPDTFDLYASIPKNTRKYNFQSGKVKMLFLLEANATSGRISGIFNNNDIILSDNGNSRIVQYDQKGLQKNELKLDGNPTDITIVNEQILAVATGSTKVFLININPLSHNKVVTLATNAHGLCFADNEFIACYEGKISWCDAKTGAKIKEINSETKQTMFVCNSGKKECIYMDKYNSFKILSMERNSYSYTNSTLNCSYCQDTDRDGNIYAVSYNNDIILQLSPEGHLIRIISLSDLCRGISGLWVIRFQKNSNRFMLTFFSIGKVLICEID